MIKSELERRFPWLLDGEEEADGGDAVDALSAWHNSLPPDKKNNWTVIGLHDTGEVYAEHVTAVDAHTAMRKIARRKGSPDQILGALPGPVGITTPCEDSSKAAYREDLHQ